MNEEQKVIPPILCSVSELAARELCPEGAEKIILDVPAFQRGLVWNPAQVEVLWDSLMRGIPIGSITLIKYAEDSNIRSKNEEKDREKATHGIFDGQQRLHAIQLGLTPYSSAESILWLDLLPEKGRSKSTSRKYFFYLTTPGQPWGYKIDDHEGETKNTLLTSAERREGATAECDVYKKPDVHDEWPHMAGLPIPFSILWEIGGKESEPHKALTAERLKAELLPYKDKPWYKRHEEAIGSLKDEHLETIAVGLRNVRNGRVVVVITPGEFGMSQSDPTQNSDVAVFFSRLNRGGTTPSQEDINYSILKSIAPAIAKIDTIANGRMQAPRLALVAMRFYMSRRDFKWKGSISRDDIYTLAKDADFSRFVIHELEEKIQTMETLLLFEASARPWGIPRIVLSGLVNSNPNLYLFLLVLSGYLSNSKEDSRLLVAVGMLVGLFSDKMSYNDCYILLFNKLYETSNHTKELLQHWLCLNIRRGALRLPPPPDIYTKLVEATKSMDMNEVENAWNPSLYKHAVEQIWSWRGFNGRILLLYTLRGYIEGKFPNYDPALSVWKEDNRPWDYDHIFPQNWVAQGKGNRRGKYHELVREFIHCIGNIAPIPYSINREKKDNAPYKDGHYIGKEEDVTLFCCYSEEDAKVMPFLKNKPAMALEDEKNKKSAFALAFWIAQRMKKIYTEFYTIFQITDLLNFTAADSKRQNLFNLFRECISENFPDYKEELHATYSIVYTGKQEKIDSSAELSFPWLACGVKIQFPSSEMRGLLCICSNGEQVEWGIRRHPDDSMVENNPGVWWLPSRLLPKDMSELSPWYEKAEICQSKSIDQVDIEEIVKGVSDLLEYGGIEPCAPAEK